MKSRSIQSCWSLGLLLAEVGRVNEINVTLVHVTQIDYFLLWEDQIVVAGLWETVCSERCNGIIIWSLSSE